MIVSAEQILANIRNEQADRPGNRGPRAHRPTPAPKPGNGVLVATPAEQQLLARIAEGWSNAGIASDNRVSEDTVKSQIRVLFKKLGASSRANAVHLGHQKGLLS